MFVFVPGQGALLVEGLVALVTLVEILAGPRQTTLLARLAGRVVPGPTQFGLLLQDEDMAGVKACGEGGA